MAPSLSVLFPYPNLYLQLAFLPEVQNEEIMDWASDSTVEKISLLSSFNELGLRHYLIAAIEQTATSNHM